MRVRLTTRGTAELRLGFGLGRASGFSHTLRHAPGGRRRLDGADLRADDLRRRISRHLLLADEPARAAASMAFASTACSRRAALMETCAVSLHGPACGTCVCTYCWPCTLVSPEAATSDWIPAPDPGRTLASHVMKPHWVMAEGGRKKARSGAVDRLHLAGSRALRAVKSDADQDVGIYNSSVLLDDLNVSCSTKKSAIKFASESGFANLVT